MGSEKREFLVFAGNVCRGCRDVHKMSDVGVAPFRDGFGSVESSGGRELNGGRWEGSLGFPRWLGVWV